MVRDRTSNPGQLPVLSFFVFTYAWSWASWSTAAAMGFAITEPPGLLLYLLGVLGPLVGAVWVARCGGRAYRRALLRRIWDPRSISARWWLALLVVGGGPAVAAVVGISLTGQQAMAPGLSAGVVVAMVGPALVAGLAEEPGWRGAVSDAWQARTRPVWAAAGIGVLWSVWHLPLSFVEGSYYHNLEVGSVRVGLTHLMLVQLGILLVWLVNGAGGAILLAVLAHAGFNVAIGLVAGSPTRDVVVLLVLTAAAVTVTVMTNGRLGLPAGGAHERAGRSSPHAPPPTDGGPRSSSASGHT